jgi:hypothetical protein
MLLYFISRYTEVRIKFAVDVRNTNIINMIQTWLISCSLTDIFADSLFLE